MTASRAETGEPFEIGGHSVLPGEHARFEMPVAVLPTQTQLHFPVTVLNGLRPGPRLWVNAAIHGDELNGVEVIARTLSRIQGPLLRGSLVAVPIVNVFGFLQGSRYLPDRRDLNRSFPGSPRGSLASRVAHIFMTEIVERCTHGIDIHTAASERDNYPQTRCDLDDPETRRIAEAFRAPVMVHSSVRDGSLRGAARKRDIPVLVYEAGQARRFDEVAVETGARGLIGVLRELGMVGRRQRTNRLPSAEIRSSSWVRARRGGILRLFVRPGEWVEKQQLLGTVADPFGEEQRAVRAPFAGVVIGIDRNPVVHGGDAVVHVGRLNAEG